MRIICCYASVHSLRALNILWLYLLAAVYMKSALNFFVIWRVSERPAIHNDLLIDDCVSIAAAAAAAEYNGVKTSKFICFGTMFAFVFDRIVLHQL